MKGLQLPRFIIFLLISCCLLLSACGGGSSSSSSGAPDNYFLMQAPSGITLPQPDSGTATGSVKGDFSNGNKILSELASGLQPVQIQNATYGDNPDTWYKHGELRIQDNGDGTWTFTLKDNTGKTVAALTGYAWLLDWQSSAPITMVLYLIDSATQDPTLGVSGDFFRITLDLKAHIYAWYEPTSGDSIWFGNGLVESYGEKVHNALIQLAGTWTGSNISADSSCTDATKVTLTIDTAGTVTYSNDGTEAGCQSFKRRLVWSKLDGNSMQNEVDTFSIDMHEASDNYTLELEVDDWKNPSRITHVYASRGQQNDNYLSADPLTKQP